MEASAHALEDVEHMTNRTRRYGNLAPENLGFHGSITLNLPGKMRYSWYRELLQLPVPHGSCLKISSSTARSAQAAYGLWARTPAQP
jgi:hypothetical protein